MKFKGLGQKTALLFLWALINQTAHSTELNLEFIQKTESIARIPAIQLDWIIRSAKDFPQIAPVQNAVAQIVENTSSNFESLDNRGRYKLLKAYNQLLTSPLLRDDQKDYLRNTVIPKVTPLVQPLDSNQVSASDLETQRLFSTLAAQHGTGTPVAQAVQTVAQATDQIPVAELTPSVLTSEARPMAPAFFETPITATTPATTVALAAMPTSQGTGAVASPTAAPISQVIQTSAPAVSQLPIAAALPGAVASTALATATLANTPAAQATAIVAAPAAVQTVQASMPGTSVLPVATPLAAAAPAALSTAAITAITQNAQLNTTAKVVALTNLINTSSTSTPADTNTAATVAQTIQDLYNAQTPADVKPISDLLQATLQKPLLAPEQKNYVTTTLVPAIAQQLATLTPVATLAPMPALTSADQPLAKAIPAATKLSTPITTSAITGQVVQNATASVATQQPSFGNFAAAAAPAANTIATSIDMPTLGATQASQSDIEGIIKALYSQMQTAQGNSYDATTQGAFGASLVEAFNQIVELQSYMSQLLITAEGTPLLNEAQHQYVRDVMMPNLDQVSGTTPTKTLDHAVAADTAKAGKRAKGASSATKKKKGKKAAAGATTKKAKKGKKSSTADMGAAHDASAATPDASTTAHEAKASTGKKKGSKKLKKAKPAPDATADAAPATAGSDPKAEHKPAGKKKGKKKGTHVKKEAATSPETPTSLTAEVTVEGEAAA